MLRPYATKPKPSVANTLHGALMTSPMARPMIIEPRPEKMPFKSTILSGSFEDSLLVQLFSIPQHTHARSMKS